jgi:FtsP/CotA-like multicopper oxidase with cupredoxin domain
MTAEDARKLNRRKMLGLVSAGGALVGSGILDPARIFAQGCSPDLGLVPEPVPTSPLILSPFTDQLPIPTALRPSDPTTWRDPRTGALAPPGPGIGKQDSRGGTHQVWTSTLGLPNPICYKIDLRVNEHRFTTSLVQPINSLGQNVTPPDGISGPRSLPASTIYGFNGKFPGPMINAEYGKPALVRFENHLDENPLNLDRQDFGAPDLGFLTHLHNGHTAPESDGNPHYNPNAYQPKQWVDNLYLNWPAAGDAREMQSFFWFHDHRMDHTGANVYKGMVGLYPIYDPQMDTGDETKGYHLPGVRTDNKDGTFNTAFDIPLAFYDCRLNDGVTPHQDFHTSAADCGKTHPEWWGKTFFRHYPNHGFVGDIFTVNGTAYPVLEVKRRKYRFRLLDASISRIYEFKLMRGTVVPSPGQQGQFHLAGQQCMQMTQVASEGGLLPAPIVRDSIQIWPAKRREIVIDFSKYADGTATKKGDVVYLVNVLEMQTGRKPGPAVDCGEEGQPACPMPDPNYAVPVLKFVLDSAATDRSVIPANLRPLPTLPSEAVLAGLTHRTFTLQRSGGGGLGSGGSSEAEWLINGLPFDPLNSMSGLPPGSTEPPNPRQNRPEVWTLTNGGGGWVHPLHIHMEEHQILSRSGGMNVGDVSKEDVVALGPNESVTFYRNFRTFLGPYVCHCHNLAHEDHAMMFGWQIDP